jgi:hypothetical protein
MMEVISAAELAKLKPRVDDFCRNYFDDFVKNKSLYAPKDGYHRRGIAALCAADYLRNTARVEKNTKLVEFYNAKRSEYANELMQLGEGKRW